MELAELRVRDQGELAAHAVGIVEPNGLEGASVFDDAAAVTARRESRADLSECFGRRRAERNVIEVPAREHLGAGLAVTVAGDLDGMKPQARASPQIALR